jgi:microcystin degradation protein MlrC
MATNKFRKVRLVQQLSVTDGHDQLTHAIWAMLDNMVQYGQYPLKLAATDNMLHNWNMMMEEIESMQATQRELDKFTKKHFVIRLPVLCTILGVNPRMHVPWVTH